MYLQNIQSVTADVQYTIPPESAETVVRIESRLQQILRFIIQSHHGRDELPVAPDVETNIQVVYPDCETAVSAIKYLKLQTCPNCSVE